MLVQLGVCQVGHLPLGLFDEAIAVLSAQAHWGVMGSGISIRVGHLPLGLSDEAIGAPPLQQRHGAWVAASSKLPFDAVLTPVRARCAYSGLQGRCVGVRRFGALSVSCLVTQQITGRS